MKFNFLFTATFENLLKNKSILLDILTPVDLYKLLKALKMGKHPKYFCSSVRNTVLTISIWMMFSYFVATVVTIGFCVIGDTPGKSSL